MLKLFLVLITILLTVAGQLCFKKAAVGGLLLQNLINPFIILGLFLYGLSTIAYLNVLRFIKLSIAFPVIFGISACLVVLFSVVLYCERLNQIQVLGVVVVILGITLLNIK